MAGVRRSSYLPNDPNLHVYNSWPHALHHDGALPVGWTSGHSVGVLKVSDKHFRASACGNRLHS